MLQRTWEASRFNQNIIDPRVGRLGFRQWVQLPSEASREQPLDAAYTNHLVVIAFEAEGST